MVSRVLRGSSLGNPYDLLGKLQPGLMLDVGAAAGWQTEKMLKASPDSRVIAFEPFPGNHRFIDERVGSDPRVSIVKKAVASRPGTAKMFVNGIVTNGAGAWAGMEGYSSCGVLVADTDKRAAEAIEVEICRLDDEASEPIRFMKIDVQGEEFGVLDGARNLFDRHGVEMVLAEFIGDPRVVSFLAEREYTIFDTAYHVLLPSTLTKASDWRITDVIQLSTGAECALATPLQAPEDPAEYATWFKAQQKAHRPFWTDLLAVAPGSSII